MNKKQVKIFKTLNRSLASRVLKILNRPMPHVNIDSNMPSWRVLDREMRSAHMQKQLYAIRELLC